ncbi:MAG: EamA family transporter [Bacteroidota bacterium]
MIEQPTVSDPRQTPASLHSQWQRVALIAFLSQGGAGICQKSLAELSGEYRLLFLLSTYLVAVVLSGWLFRQRRSRLCLQSVILGSIAGLTCVLSVYFLLAALKTLPGVVVFMVVPVSALGLTLMSGWLIFHERLSKAQTLGVLMAVAGIVLVQL